MVKIEKALEIELFYLGGSFANFVQLIYITWKNLRYLYFSNGKYQGLSNGCSF
jgi:hypothetical protein